MQALRAVSTASLCSVSLCSVALAQVTWQRLEVLTLRARPAVARLPGGPTTLLATVSSTPLGPTSETWEWNGTRWTRRLTGTTPPAGDAVAVTDSRRGRIVVVIANPVTQTWTWDGRDWQEQAGAQLAPRGGSFAMAYDTGRDRVVLYGAEADGTWEFDGSQWVRIGSATQPGRRLGSAMAYDAARQRVVMFGGATSLPSADTWEWDGAAWQLRAVSGPPGRYLHAMAYDPASRRTLVFGGSRLGSRPFLDDLWSWDGANWTEIVTPTRPAARDQAVLVADPSAGGVLMTGGIFTGDTWRYDGSGWLRLADAAAPTRVTRGAMTTTPARDGVVLQNGAECWSLRRGEWHRELSGPPPREMAAMALDSQRGRAVLFGGHVLNTALDDTWEWDGHTWARASAPSAPPARLDHAMAYDAARARVVLFGGGVPGTYFDDTWEWDGQTWTQRIFASAPSPRALHGMAYDPVRRVVVLFGGSVGTGGSFETWTYDGSGWQRRTPAHTPDVAYGFSAMVYDEARARVVLCGDRGNVWEWDGDDWEHRATRSIDNQLLPALAYDPLAAVVVAIGDAGSVGAQDAYVYGPVFPAAVATYGAGCGPAPRPQIIASGRPWVGEALALDADDLAATASAAAFFVGASDRNWNGVTLPLSLAIVGMSGCALLASPDVMLVAPAVRGRATAHLALPDLPSLLGASLFVQSLAPAPGANQLGLVTTNALALRIGHR